MLLVRLFGDTRVLDGTRTLGPGDFGGLKPRRILEALALHRGRQVSKDRLADILWADRPPPDHMATLESYVSLLRRRLQPGTPARHSVIRTVPRAYLLDPSTARTDLDVFDDLVARARHRVDREAHELLDRASALASAELLGASDEAGWAEPIRADYRQRAVRAAVRAAELALPHDTDAALRSAGRALGSDVLCEPAWRMMILAHATAGHRTEALRAYRACRRLLAKELGVEPASQTRALLADVLARTREDASAPDLGAVLDAAFAVFEYQRTGDAPDRIDDAVRTLSGLLEHVSPAPTTTTGTTTGTVDHHRALRGAGARLRDEFGGTFGHEIIQRFLHAGYDDFVARSSVRQFLPLLAERSVRQRLRALAAGDAGTPTVVFTHTRQHGHSQMALGFFGALAGDHALAWPAGPEPATFDAGAVAAMAERGIDITGRFRTPWANAANDAADHPADVVVTFGTDTTAAPRHLGRRHEHWDLGATTDVHAVRDELERRVRALLHDLGVRPG